MHQKSECRHDFPRSWIEHCPIKVSYTDFGARSIDAATRIRLQRIDASSRKYIEVGS